MEKRKESFEQLVATHKDTIYMVCYMFSHDEDEVADLVQESLINLWRGMKTCHDDANVKGWIYRVTLNTCISIDRKKKRHATERLVMVPNLFDGETPHERTAEMLHRRISRLQPFDRAIILLWLEDISYEEIGQILGISTKNVSVRLYRIREQLKTMTND